jgi:hypothetical protein
LVCLATLMEMTAGKISKVLKEVFYGMTAYELELELKKEKGDLDKLFMLMIFGDLVGLPFFPPYYSMRLLPHIIPLYTTWRRSVLRERDITDIISGDI